jgi:hypothetical protein
MKSKLLFGFAVTTLFLTATVFTSCEKDPCEDVTCLNGGTCIDGECDCPEGYTGSDCGDQITPSNIRVSKISITKFPSYNNGSDWDTWSAGPDIYVLIKKNSTTIHEQPTMWEDADAAQDYTYEPNSPIDLSEPTVQYTISLYDYDSTGDNDFMGGINFYPYSSDNDFPNTLYIDAGGDVSFELDVSYAW